MNRLPLLLAVAVFSASTYAAEPAVNSKVPPAAPPATRAKKPVDPSLLPIADEPGLPRVLLIGDSISMGYTLPVRELLKGRANVHHPPENCGPSSRGVYHLDAWLGAGKWDVIQFNFGLHDLKYLDEKGDYVSPDKGKQVATLEEYEKNLREITSRLRRTGAKLIYATTTPVPAGSRGRTEGDEKKYNEVALRVMKEQGIAVNDLAAFVTPKQGALQLPQNVHFTPAGYRALGEEVAQIIAKSLPAPSAK